MSKKWIPLVGGPFGGEFREFHQPAPRRITIADPPTEVVFGQGEVSPDEKTVRQETYLLISDGQEQLYIWERKR